MIFKFKYFSHYELPCVPYPLQWLEPNYAYEKRKRFAWFPRRLFEYEDRKSINMGGMTPDDYRMFIGTEKIIWLESYIEFRAYGRSETRMPPPHKSRTYAVDPYFVMITCL